jgi:hypothetical protein
MAFFLKANVMLHYCRKSAGFCVEIVKFFGKIKKIMTLTPGRVPASADHDPQHRQRRRGPHHVCTQAMPGTSFLFLVSLVALSHRNKDTAPFRHPVDVFSSFCPIVWQHFARHCRQFRSEYFYAPITW